jgi:hypothetical protein
VAFPNIPEMSGKKNPVVLPAAAVAELLMRNFIIEFY